MKLFDRDLSWLSFNYRVLMEAMDKSVPLLERLRFIAIYSSNLDEFFRVRVANIRNIKQIDKKKINKRLDFDAGALLEQIHSEVSHQLEEYGEALQSTIQSLNEAGHCICTHTSEIPAELEPQLLHYFKTKVSAYLRPIHIEKKDELFLDNQAIYLTFKTKTSGSYILKIPTDKLGRFASYKVDSKAYYVFLDDIIRMHLDSLFPGVTADDVHSIKLNKDADLQIDDEFEGNLVRKIEKQIHKRNLGIPSRFLFDVKMNDALLTTLADKLKLSSEDMITGGRYHNLNDFFQINIKDDKLIYRDQPAISVKSLDQTKSIFKCIESQDYLLHFPYQSYDYILQFFNEAAIDSDVTEINVTFYRMAKNSVIAEALISAANNGKKVAVFMEVKARFDEQNNLEWAQKMKAAGVKVLYSLPGLKVHAKVALVKKRDKMYGFFGTGNLNEKTSEIYCDHGLMTINEDMTRELSNVFQHLLTKYTPPPFEKLIVSQFGAYERFLEKIDREIAHAEAGREARIIIKVNNLQEQTLINKLYEASIKGVDVKLIVRSICCLVPNKNLKVKRIVDRYLEHGRIFYFHDDGAQEVYLGSADWMNRNLHRRVEVCFPIQEDGMKQELLSFLKFQWTDDVKGVWLSQKLANKRPKVEKEVRAQVATYEYLLNQYG
ncbi:polyphosphate kinase [Ekhidna lutea]|uniref:Polyphosphate kinase n=1 Tax=Ekhidna lutea TaxID=447679 RepID=A0A239IEN7_EKHLU|nr:polyphosphate kinase 1 [Ekhidna lutea]SNS91892.1 polyphosphate kinase [Ekhidna lutea]